MIRVNYDPKAPGSLLLNANMCYLYERIPHTPFQLGYISMTSDAHKPFDLFWVTDVIPYIEQCGYAIEDASAIYTVVSTGEEQYGPDFIGIVHGTLQSGFSVDDAIGLLKSAIHGTCDAPVKRIYPVFCMDPSLGEKMRRTSPLST